MKITEILQEKVEMCPKACCGMPVPECTCGPDCKHCDCYEKNKKMNEMTTASSIATVSGNVGGQPQSRTMYNADGTMKNGADYGNLLGGKKKPTKKKKA